VVASFILAVAGVLIAFGLPAVIGQENQVLAFWVGMGLVAVSVLVSEPVNRRLPRVVLRWPDNAAPLRIRLANWPDATAEWFYDFAHLAVTNDHPTKTINPTIKAIWGATTKRLYWEPGPAEVVAIPPGETRTLSLCLRSRDAGHKWESDLSPTRRRFDLEQGTCYVCDDNFHRDGVAGATLPTGQRTEVRIQVDAETGRRSTRFAVYVPTDMNKPMWVVPVGASGSD
jgi:hypothetical protein